MALRPGSKGSIDNREGEGERGEGRDKGGGEVGRVRMIPAPSSLEVHYTK